MLRGSDPIGAITVWHADVDPFTAKHVALLQTFADQAVIAIENVGCSKNSKIVGAADGDERNLGRHRKLANGHSAGVGRRRGERRATVRS